MEPPAVNVGVGFQRSTNNLDKNRRDLMLRIDSHPISYASTSRHMFELPENFLETISPQQNTSCSLELNQTSHIHNDLGTSSCLSPGIAADQRYSNENVDMLPHLSDHQGGIDSSGLLTTSTSVDDLSETRRPTYIKEEFYLPSYDDEHEEDELLRNQSPISMQNDLVSSVLSSDEHFLPIRQQASVKSPPSESKEALFQVKTEEETPNSTNDYSSLIDPLNTDLDSDVFIDTKSLCVQIANELKQHSIPQAVFAEKVLCRSQGTLSDLLRNPKPWPKLKSGRETFRRMSNWMNQPQHIRLAILDMKDTSDLASLINNLPPTPAAKSSTRVRQASVSDDGNFQSKRPRLVFTDVQKRTLQAIFKETQRPSREMQNTIAEHLGLDLSTVSNFFMNARRRSRGLTNVDSLDQLTPPSSNTPTKQSYRRHNPSTSSSTTNSSSHINDTVDAVIAGYGSTSDAELQQGPSNYSGNRRRSSARQRIKLEDNSLPSLLHENNHL